MSFEHVFEACGCFGRWRKSGRRSCCEEGRGRIETKECSIHMFEGGHRHKLTLVSVKPPSSAYNSEDGPHAWGAVQGHMSVDSIVALVAWHGVRSSES